MFTASSLRPDAGSHLHTSVHGVLLSLTLLPDGVVGPTG